MVERGAGVLRGDLPAGAVDEKQSGQQNRFPYHPPDDRPGPRVPPLAVPTDPHPLQRLCPHLFDGTWTFLRIGPGGTLALPWATPGATGEHRS